MPVEQALDARFTEHVGGQWERLCREAVTGNRIGGVLYGPARRWWGSVLGADGKPESVEFDIVAESLDKRQLLVGECKWTERENGERLTAELLRKAALLPFAGQHAIVPMLFLKNVPTQDVGNALLPEDVVEMSY